MEIRKMQYLQEMMYISFTERASRKLAKINEQLESLVKKKESLLKEGFIDDHNGPLEAKFDEIKRKVLAAERAIGISNRIKDPIERRKHKSRIMSLMNKLRHGMYDIMIELGVEDSPDPVTPKWK